MLINLVISIFDDAKLRRQKRKIKEIGTWQDNFEIEIGQLFY